MPKQAVFEEIVRIAKIALLQWKAPFNLCLIQTEVMEFLQVRTGHRTSLDQVNNAEPAYEGTVAKQADTTRNCGIMAQLHQTRWRVSEAVWKIGEGIPFGPEV
jgi:hypothetical protein